MVPHSQQYLRHAPRRPNRKLHCLSRISAIVCVLLSIWSQESCCLERGVGTWNMHMRWHATYDIIVIFNANPPDSTTYLSYVDFAKGLLKPYTKATFNLLVYHERSKTLKVVFANVLGRDLRPEAWSSRERSDTRSGQNVTHLLHNPAVVLALDVNVSQAVPLCKPSEQLSYERMYGADLTNKCYQIVFKRNAPKTQTNSFFRTNLKKEGSFERLPYVQLNTIYFRKIGEFYKYFPILYGDIAYASETYIKCDGDYCQTAIERSDTSNVYVMFTFQKQSDKRVVFKLLVFRRRVNIPTAQFKCSNIGMSLLSLRSKAQMRTTRQFMRNSVFLSKMYYGNAEFPAFPTIHRRSSLKVGRRFALDDKKDMLYSFWDEGEPSLRNCVMFSSKQFLAFAVRCSHKRLKLALCVSEVTPQTGNIVYTVVVLNGTKQTIYQEYNIKVAVENSSNTLRSESTGMILHNFGNSKRLVIDARSFHPLQGICEIEEANITTIVAMPMVYFCDGKIDCPSGSDEHNCGISGIASCATGEWTCASRQCVPSEARCDLIHDCQDGSDEEGCGFECKHRLCNNGRCLPKPWFNDGQIDCEDGSDESEHLRETETCVFLCNRTQCVRRWMLNDSVVHCKGPEGPLDETLGALESMDCTKRNGESIMNNWAPRCVLARDSFGEVIGCRNFQHLEDCENFTCPLGYVKCPSSFCIPLSYVRDKEDDCYEGEDELFKVFQNYFEHPVFQCLLSTPQAIHLSAVCDGRQDCGQGEDEVGCGTSCLPGTMCFPGAVSVVSFNKSLQLPDFSLIDNQIRFLDLSGVDVNDFFNSVPQDHFAHVIDLILSRCYIKSRSLVIGVTNDMDNDHECSGLSKNRNFRTVKMLNLSYNNITQLSDCSHLKLMSGLQVLDMSHNYQLSDLSKFSLRGFYELKSLDLSFTSIKSLERDIFQDLVSLNLLTLYHCSISKIEFILPSTVTYLNMDDTPIKHVGKNAFSKTRSIDTVRSSTYKMCCPQVIGSQVSKSVCQSPPSGGNSCSDLIEEVLLRSVLWLTTLAILTSNSLALMYRLVWDTKLLHKPYGLFVTNLGVSDLIMGIYLLIVGVADATYRDQYVLHDYIWRNSYTCWTAGVLGTLSSLASTLFIALITLDRFFAVRYPYGDVKFTAKTMTAAVILTWLFSTTIASLPLLPFAQHWTYFSFSGMCLGLPLDSSRPPGWLLSVILFIGFSFLFFVLIGAGQIAIFKTILKKGKRTKKYRNPSSQQRENQRMQEVAIAKRLAIVVVSDFISWFPVILMGILTMLGYDLGPGAYRWSAILIIPVNSALNPLLYTMPALRDKLSAFVAIRKEANRVAARAARKRKLQGQGRCVAIMKPSERNELFVTCFTRILSLRRRLCKRQITTKRVEVLNLQNKVLGVKQIIEKYTL